VAAGAISLALAAGAGDGSRDGASIDVDFHTVPTNSTEEPLEKHYVSRRSRSQVSCSSSLLHASRALSPTRGRSAVPYVVSERS